MSVTQQYSFSTTAQNALHIAQQLAKESMHEAYGAAHLLKALLHKDVGLAPLLEQRDVDIYYLEEWAIIRMEAFPKASKPITQLEADTTLKPVWTEAEQVQLQLGYAIIEPECLLAAMAMPGVVFSYEQLKSFPIAAPQIIEWFGTGGHAHANGVHSHGTASIAKQKIQFNALSQYCIDKTSLAAAGMLQTVIGRDSELRKISEIVSRYNKSNAIIVGESGVGKSALLDGYAVSVAQGKVPIHLKDITIYEVDNSAILAGAAYKGEIEDRFQKIFNELSTLEKPILFIDEIHTYFDSANSGVSSIFKSALAKGIITIVATATADAYRKYIEKDATFSRRFELVKLEEPLSDVAEKMLLQQADILKEHHQLELQDSVFPLAVQLSKRYIKDRKLPDAAIDLLDRTMAVFKIMQDTSQQDVATFTERMDNLRATATDDELTWLYYEMQGSLTPTLLARVEETTSFNKNMSLADKSNHIDTWLKELSIAAASLEAQVTVGDVNAVISNITGIPIGKIQSKEQQQLVNMEDHLRKRVIGQDHALKIVSEAILESRSGLNKAGQPIASFFFLGPTGTGKTELAKSLSEFLFQDENAIIRFDMSEFKEEHSAALLYGAPPGYVGYEEGGMLVNKIRSQPYAIVLFDEIEKAHPSVFDIFLQILDEGKMHDRLGKMGDFSNAVILFTSNIGAEHIISSFNEKRIPSTEDMLESMSRFFRPEFLARITEIVPFAPVSEENVLKIFRIHYQPLVLQLAQQGITLEVIEAAQTHLAQQGFSPKYGVRPLKSVIRTALRKPLSKMIVKGELYKDCVVTADLQSIDDTLQIVWNIKPQT
jgi:ATP-dependent Clp protease ATP-binding subunit ClpB